MAEKITRIKILANPRASQNLLAGFSGEELKVRLTAPPVDGAFNQALIKFMAKLLKIKNSDLSLDSGQTSRHKILTVKGLDKDDLMKRLAAHLPSPEASPETPPETEQSE